MSALDDLRACVRWFRSTRGPLYQEWQTGSLGLEDAPGVPSFRLLLKLLDGSDADVRRIDIMDVPVCQREVRALFSMYRRMRRAEQREARALMEAGR